MTNDIGTARQRPVIAEIFLPLGHNGIVRSHLGRHRWCSLTKCGRNPVDIKEVLGLRCNGHRRGIGHPITVFQVDRHISRHARVEITQYQVLMEVVACVALGKEPVLTRGLGAHYGECARHRPTDIGAGRTKVRWAFHNYRLIRMYM